MNKTTREIIRRMAKAKKNKRPSFNAARINLFKIHLKSFIFLSVVFLTKI